MILARLQRTNQSVDLVAVQENLVHLGWRGKRGEMRGGWRGEREDGEMRRDEGR